MDETKSWHPLANTPSAEDIANRLQHPDFTLIGFEYFPYRKWLDLKMYQHYKHAGMVLEVVAHEICSRLSAQEQEKQLKLYNDAEKFFVGKLNEMCGKTIRPDNHTSFLLKIYSVGSDYYYLSTFRDWTWCVYLMERVKPNKEK